MSGENIRGSPEVGPARKPEPARRYDLPVAHGREAGIPLVGRDSELSILRDAIDGATRGPCRVVVVEGEAGIGKSRLLEEATRHAERRGYRVFCGSAEELERNRPFATLAGALGDGPEPRIPPATVARPLSVGDEAPSRIEPGVDHVRFGFVDEFVAFLASQAHQQPVVFAVDDLQWADPSTLLAVRALSRRVADLSFVVLLALRPTPRSRDLRSFLDGLLGSGAEHLILGPLEEGAVTALVGSVLGTLRG